MPSHNEVDGVPSHGNPWLLRDVLREELNFKKGVISTTVMSQGFRNIISLLVKVPVFQTLRKLAESDKHNFVFCLISQMKQRMQQCLV